MFAAHIRPRITLITRIFSSCRGIRAGCGPRTCVSAFSFQLSAFQLFSSPHSFPSRRLRRAGGPLRVRQRTNPAKGQEPSAKGIIASRATAVRLSPLPLTPSRFASSIPYPFALTSSRANQRSRAFTLIELLVVITIILVLMGLLFPAIRGAQDQAKKVQAKNDLTQIVTAVNAYYTEYGMYPLNSGNNGGGADTVYGDPNGTYSSADLFDVLRAVPDSNYNAGNQLNPRQVVYFSGNSAKDLNNPRSGFASGASTITNSNGYSIQPGSYVDPWGDAYVVFIDADYSGDIAQSLGWFYNDFSGGTTSAPRVGVGAASLGKDGTWGSAGGS